MATERRGFLLGILIIVLLVLLGGAAVGIFRAGPPPVISIAPATPVIGKRTPVKIDISETARGLSSVKVEFIQGDQVSILAERSYEPRSALNFWGAKTDRDTLNVEVGRDTIAGLKPGNAVIRVSAGRASTWLRHPAPAVQEVNLPVHLTPPTLQVSSIQTYVAQGGCEVVLYRVGESAVRDGVQAADWWFPGYPLPGGGKQERFALFAVPYDMAEPKVRLVAADAAGNEAERSFIDKFFPKPPKTDSIEVSDAFMAKVVPEIMAQSPDVKEKGTPLDNYLAINSELRKINAAELKALARKSQNAFLWHKPFLMMANAKVMAGFADHRTYLYQGRTVDQQDHLGFDQAVTAHAPVTAANDGVVVLARYFGIYGNAIVIDHGYGLMSLYGHLSSIAVQPGQKVVRGEELGRTGETGLAGGDHLHFTTLLQGLPVNPVEWWDGHWIQDRFAAKLGPAFRFEP